MTHTEYNFFICYIIRINFVNLNSKAFRNLSQLYEKTVNNLRHFDTLAKIISTTIAKPENHYYFLNRILNTSSQFNINQGIDSMETVYQMQTAQATIILCKLGDVSFIINFLQLTHSLTPPLLTYSLLPRTKSLCHSIVI